MKFRTIAAMIAAPLMAAGIALPTMAAASAGTNDGTQTTLTVNITAIGSQQKVYHWTLGKSVTTDQADYWLGDTVTAHWTVTADRDQGTLGQRTVAGDISVTNGGSNPTIGLTVDPKLYLSGSGQNSQQPLYDPGVNLATGQLAAGQTQVYHYSMTLPDSLQLPAGQYTVGNAVTIMNHGGHVGTAYGPPAWSSPFGSFALTQVNASIHVTDSNGKSWDFPAAGSPQTYDTQYKADKLGDLTESNTATGSDGSTASAQFTVKVWGLDIAKAITGTSFTRTYLWTLGPVAQDSLRVYVGTPGEITIPVSVTFKDTNYEVDGTITISNPAPIAASLAGVTDSLQGAQITDKVPDSLAPGDSVVLHFTYKPSDDSAGVNTAEVKLSNGTPFESNQAAFDFSSAQINSVDKGVDVHITGTVNGNSALDGHVAVTEP